VTARTFAVVLGLCVGLGLVIAGCGDDDTVVVQRPPATPTPAGPAGPNAKAQPLPDKLHIEDRVSCAIPDQPTDPKNGACDPKVPSCAEHLYCLQLTQGYFCEPCPERDGIRHVFKERDFAAEQNRDPFQSNLLSQVAIGQRAPLVPLDPTKKCLHKDQMVATSYSYAELKLVGIVTQGTQRKVLMMGGPLGYIIKRGDCVGKEKAVVKDIGTGYITFLVDPDPVNLGQRGSEEYSVQLNPKQLTAGDSELPSPARAATPPAVPPSAPPAGSGAAVAPPVASPPVVPKKP